MPLKNSYEKENDKWAYEEFEKESPTREEKFLTNILGAVVSRVVSDCIYFLICKLKFKIKCYLMKLDVHISYHLNELQVKDVSKVAWVKFAQM